MSPQSSGDGDSFTLAELKRMPVSGTRRPMVSALIKALLGVSPRGLFLASGSGRNLDLYRQVSQFLCLECGCDGEQADDLPIREVITMLKVKAPPRKSLSDLITWGPKAAQATSTTTPMEPRSGGKVPKWLKPVDAMLLLKRKVKQRDQESQSKYDRRVRHAFDLIKESMPSEAKEKRGKVEWVDEIEFKGRVGAWPIESNRGRPPAGALGDAKMKEQIRAEKVGDTKGKKNRWSCKGCGNLIIQAEKPERCPKCPSGGSFEPL